MADQALPLTFDPNRTPEENIDRFMDHLSSVDAELTHILKQHVAALLPLSTNPQQKTRGRESANQAISTALDKLTSSQDDNH